jgi:integrase
MRSVPIALLRDEIESLHTPPFGSVATWKIARQILDGLAAWIRSDPKGPANTYKLLSSLRHTCNYAVLKGWLKTSPFAFRKLDAWVRDHNPDGDDDEPVVRHHPLSELTRVLLGLQSDAAQGWQSRRLFTLAATTFLTGARAREIQGSRVEDYDLVEGWLKIRPNAKRRLKTKSARRKVPLTSELTDVLSAWMPLAESEWAFPGERRLGPWMTGMSGRTPVDRLKQAGERYGLKGLTFQSLRHSFITHSAGPWGLPDLLSQRIAGHTRRETTEGYRGFDATNVREAISAIFIGLIPIQRSA